MECGKVTIPKFKMAAADCLNNQKNVKKWSPSCIGCFVFQFFVLIMSGLVGGFLNSFFLRK